MRVRFARGEKFAKWATQKNQNHIQFEDVLNLHDVIGIKNGGNVICHRLSMWGEEKEEEKVCQIKNRKLHMRNFSFDFSFLVKFNFPRLFLFDFDVSLENLKWTALIFLST